MTELTPEQTAYQAALNAANFKGAFISLREASQHLERADDPALLKECKELGKKIVKAAFDRFHEKYPDLWQGFEGEHDAVDS